MKCLHCEDKRRNENEDSLISQLNFVAYKLKELFKENPDLTNNLSLNPSALLSSISALVNFQNYELVYTIQDYLQISLDHLQSLKNGSNEFSPSESYEEHLNSIQKSAELIKFKIGNLNSESMKFFEAYRMISKIEGLIGARIKEYGLQSESDFKRVQNLFNREANEPKNIMVITGDHIRRLSSELEVLKPKIENYQGKFYSMDKRFTAHIENIEELISSLEVTLMLNSNDNAIQSSPYSIANRVNND